jgi:hypothetical protein
VVTWTFLPFQIANEFISFHSISIWPSCTNLANKQMVIYCNIMYFFWKSIFQCEWYIFFLHKWTLGTLSLQIHSILGTFQYYMLQKDVSFGYPIVGTNPSIPHYSINHYLSKLYLSNIMFMTMNFFFSSHLIRPSTFFEHCVHNLMWKYYKHILCQCWFFILHHCHFLWVDTMVIGNVELTNV